MTIRAAILGGTGYGGMELLRYLLGHPEVEVTALTSRSEDGPVADRYPHLRGLTSLRFTREAPGVLEDLARANDVLFSAKPHGVAAKEVPPLLETDPDVRVIDLSGDFRLEAEQYPTWYGWEHPNPQWLGQAHYGFPEGGEPIPEGTRLVANPGCHAIAALLALWPARDGFEAAGPKAPFGIPPPRLVSVTGSSGGGAQPKASTHHPERFANFKAYRPLHHQHVPEVQAAVGFSVDFVPCSGPFARGIHVTAFVPATYEGQAAGRWGWTYADAPFVRFPESLPEVRAVAGTNFADVHVTRGEGVLVVTVAIDNLGKGMAGTAIQNMNRLCGLDETAGLMRAGAGL